MHDDHLVGRKKVGGRAVVWWTKVEPAPEDTEGRDVSEFRGTLDTEKSAAELVDETREADRKREERLKNIPTDE